MIMNNFFVIFLGYFNEENQVLKKKSNKLFLLDSLVK